MLAIFYSVIPISSLNPRRLIKQSRNTTPRVYLHGSSIAFKNATVDSNILEVSITLQVEYGNMLYFEPFIIE